MKYSDGSACSLDLDAPGKHTGYLSLSHSDNANAFGIIPVPIATISNGLSPTIVLTAGNHGDEYEGQVILRRLFAQTQPEDVRGRIILMPALNYPAMLADTRVSPLDNGNLNRSFPGRAGAGPTAAIARFVTDVLFPLADAAIDFHSGGHQADFLASAFVCTHTDADVTRRSVELAETFAAPYTYVVRGSDAPAGMDPHAQDQGVAFISTELSGGAGVDMAATKIGHAGLRRVLDRLGILPLTQRDPVAQTRFLDGTDAASTLMSPISGIFEPYAGLGERVAAGQPAGRVWPLEELERPAVELVFEGAGIVAARRVPARVVNGSFVYIVTPPTSREAVLAGPV